MNRLSGLKQFPETLASMSAAFPAVEAEIDCARTYGAAEKPRPFKTQRRAEFFRNFRKPVPFQNNLKLTYCQRLGVRLDTQ
jgi:hypothetical protein